MFMKRRNRCFVDGLTFGSNKCNVSITRMFKTDSAAVNG